MWGGVGGCNTVDCGLCADNALLYCVCDRERERFIFNCIHKIEHLILGDNFLNSIIC